MGNNSVSTTEQIQDQFEFSDNYDEYPFLKQKESELWCTVYHINICSQEQYIYLTQIINRYEHNQCNSIQTLIGWYQNGSNRSNILCGYQTTLYLILQGRKDRTLQEEYLARRYCELAFNQEEIISILQSILCGLREYHNKFKYNYEQITLENIIINPQTHTIILQDLILHRKSSFNQQKQIYISQKFTYPSPEKISSIYYNNHQNYDNFISNLWTIGIIALQLYNMNVMDSLYLSSSKQIDLKILNQSVNKIQNTRLRKGLFILLSQFPTERKNIYQLWGIQCCDEHKLYNLIGNQSNLNRSRQIKSKSITSLSESKIQTTTQQKIKVDTSMKSNISDKNNNYQENKTKKNFNLNINLKTKINYCNKFEYPINNKNKNYNNSNNNNNYNKINNSNYHHNNSNSNNNNNHLNHHNNSNSNNNNNHNNNNNNHNSNNNNNNYSNNNEKLNKKYRISSMKFYQK